MLQLPDALLLLALDDQKGTVIPAAFFALDHALRAAALAELRGLGVVQTRGGQIRYVGPLAAPSGSAPLDQLAGLVATLPSPGPVAQWLALIARAMPELRAALLEGLQARGVLGEGEIERLALPEQITHPVADPDAEARLLVELRAGVAAGEAVPPRMGTLTALVELCNLTPTVFPNSERPAAARVVAFVGARDSLIAVTAQVIRRAEGNE